MLSIVDYSLIKLYKVSVSWSHSAKVKYCLKYTMDCAVSYRKSRYVVHIVVDGVWKDVDLFERNYASFSWKVIIV